MKKKDKKFVIGPANIGEYSTADKEKVFKYVKKKTHGFPVIYPTLTFLGKRTILSFVDAYIADRKGKKLDEETATFDILEQDRFDPKDELAQTKIKFIDALLSPDYLVLGGVYFKGKYYTMKMRYQKYHLLLKSFLNSYFHLEDAEILEKHFMPKEKRLPFYPTKTMDGEEVMFSAARATISDKRNPEGSKEGPYNFNVFKGDLFDLNNKEDLVKVDTIFSLLSADKLVQGFYYKGTLLKDTLNLKFKLYLEKTFIKKNFCVEQVPFLMDKATLNPVNKFPLFYPMRDKNKREIVISVINAAGEGINPQYSTFDVYLDTKFDLREKEFVDKLEIIKALYFSHPGVSGILYMDGMLMTGDKNKENREYRKSKVERLLNIYISDLKDFSLITKNFTIDDRDELLNLSSYYDKYYPGNIYKVPKKDESYQKEAGFTVKFVDFNVIGRHGKYLFKENLNAEYKDESFSFSKDELTCLSAIFSHSYKPRGALFFNGVNQSIKPSGAFKKLVVSKLNEKEKKLVFNAPCEFDKYTLDRKSKMIKYWPTRDKDDREVLLSVVDADVHFKNGRQVVKAVNNATFNVYEGETFGLVGESGSGKTTISRAILGINKLKKGAIYYKGKLISSGLPKKESHRIKKDIQMIFQDPAASLNERANVDYIVSEGLYNFHLFKTKAERIEKVVNMLGEVGLLPEHLSRYPHEFSGGQRQRIGIARALVIEPQLVLADEPISALDVSIRAQVLNLLKKLQNEQQLTYIFIAHDLSIIRYISDRIAVMHNGHIVEMGIAEDIYSHPLHPYTKSLLTAIPQPDPKTKKDRKKIRYEQGNLKYDECWFEELYPQHLVLVNDELKTKILEEQKAKK